VAATRLNFVQFRVRATVFGKGRGKKKKKKKRSMCVPELLFNFGEGREEGGEKKKLMKSKDSDFYYQILGLIRKGRGREKERKKAN